MSLPRTWLLWVMLAFGLFVGWRLVAISQADRFAKSDPARALRWVQDHPQALLTQAEQQLVAGSLDEAEITARRLLEVEPLEGRGFRVLAEVADRRGDATKAVELYGIAARRSPHDIATRAWLIDHYLGRSDYATALQHVDAVLRSVPRSVNVLMPSLQEMTLDPAFSAELGVLLQQDPPWRSRFLQALLRSEDQSSADIVLGELALRDGLTDAESTAWMASLIRQGRWGEAYARWVSTLELPDGMLPLVYNGGFEKELSGQGFDWRLNRIPGIWLEIVPVDRERGRAVHAVFRGRQVAQMGLEQPLLLAPGHRYRLRAKLRAENLRSERGLEWSLTCLNQRAPFAVSEPLSGSFDWREIQLEWEVPAKDCDGQWLRVRNPVPAGSIQRVNGELWLDDVRIEPMN